MSEHVRVTVDDGVMLVVLARPEKKNALTNAMYAVLAQTLVRAEAEAAVRVVLLQGDGTAFTAGNDLGEFAAVASGTLPREAMQAQGFLAALARTQKPCVAAVHGLAVGIGVTMLMHCDIVYVAEDAELSTPFVNLGLVPEAASSMLLPARIGHARAYEMFALGEPIDGRTAAAIGLANAAFPAAQVHAKALEVARKLASRPIGALKDTKKLMRDTQALLAVLACESERFGARLRLPAAAEALRAFAERRTPDFSALHD